jgi:citrate synthase
MDRLEGLALALQPAKLVEGHLKLTDSRSGGQFDVSIRSSRESYFVNAKDLEKIRHKGEPLRIYDPGYMNTICATSAISYIDGDQGLLEYRGYPIEQLAEKSTFLETTFLLIFGELPTRGQLSDFSTKVMTHTMLHHDIDRMMRSFRYDAHPMGMLIATMSAFSTLKPEANPALAGSGVYKNTSLRNKQIYRLLGLTPSMAANAYRHRIGRPYNLPS